MKDETSHQKLRKPINETELFMKYKSSYTSAFIDFSVHIFLMYSSFYSLWYLRNSWISCFTVPLISLMNARTFIVFHDCGHNSYTPNKLLNCIIGNILGVFVFIPFCWNWHHGNHHLTSGNTTNSLNHKYNETIYHNLHQYKQWTWLKKTIYKIVRHPIVFFTLAPVLYLCIKQRTDVLRYKVNKKHPFTQSTIQIVFETVLSNAFIIGFVYYLWNCQIILHYCLCMCMFSFILFFYFHSQHTYNPSYVITNGKWTQRDSGLLGSSFITTPYIIKYFTMGIEYHHIHHMNAKIPGYNLQKYHEEVVSKSDLFDNVVTLSMTECYNNLWLVLYDDGKKRYITFAEADEEIRNDKCI